MVGSSFLFGLLKKSEICEGFIQLIKYFEYNLIISVLLLGTIVFKSYIQ